MRRRQRPVLLLLMSDLDSGLDELPLVLDQSVKSLRAIGGLGYRHDTSRPWSNRLVLWGGWGSANEGGWGLVM